MAHFKRRGPKSTRSGCLMCKAHKHQAIKDTGSARRPAQIRADESFEFSLSSLDDPRDLEDEDDQE